MAQKAYKLSDKQYTVLSTISKRFEEAKREAQRLQEVQGATFGLILDFLGLPENTHAVLNEETKELTVVESETPAETGATD